MATIDPGITGCGIQPLLVRPRVAWRMLGCGNTYGYKLPNAGELESFVDGKARKIIVASIYGYIERKLAAARSATGAATQVPSPRFHGRPRKTAAHEVRS
jgi:hypothetical protein